MQLACAVRGFHALLLFSCTSAFVIVTRVPVAKVPQHKSALHRHYSTALSTPVSATAHDNSKVLVSGVCQSSSKRCMCTEVCRIHFSLWTVVHVLIEQGQHALQTTGVPSTLQQKTFMTSFGQVNGIRNATGRCVSI
jgi:hypothetical protein